MTIIPWLTTTAMRAAVFLAEEKRVKSFQRGCQLNQIAHISKIGLAERMTFETKDWKAEKVDLKTNEITHEATCML